MTRKERLRRLRARLADLLESGELLPRLEQLPAYHDAPAEGLARWVATTLSQADRIEAAVPPYRGSPNWRHEAEDVVRDLEAAGHWTGLAPRPATWSRPAPVDEPPRASAPLTRAG